MSAREGVYSEMSETSREPGLEPLPGVRVLLLPDPTPLERPRLRSLSIRPRSDFDELEERSCLSLILPPQSLGVAFTLECRRAGEEGKAARRL